MEVILLQRIEKLGQMGDVVKVKPGYARNYLLPKKKALRATPENKARFEQQRAQLEATNLENRKEAEKVAEKADNLSVVLVRQAGESGQLYGSVSARDIADAVTDAGFRVTRQQINLDRPIKTVGLHPIRVDLHPEVSVKVTANVARSAAEAETQAKTGAAVIYIEPGVTAEAIEEAPSQELATFFEEGAAPTAEKAEESAEKEEKAGAAEEAPKKRKREKKS